MPEDPDAANSRAFPSGLASAEAELRLRGSLDIAEITRLALDTAVPGFADAAGVFLADHPARSQADSSGPASARRVGTRIARGHRPAPHRALPVGEVVAFHPDSPYGRCLRDSQPAVFGKADRWALHHVHPGNRSLVSGYASFLVVPVVSGRRAAGFLAFARTAASPEFGETDTAIAGRLASAAGTGVASALTLLREQSLSETLQHSLLAAEPEAPDGIETAARCQAADGQIAGGDWYDMFPLPGGRAGLVIGDVMGHGPEAAAVMAQLRTAAHALAGTGLKPADLLGHLDRTTLTLRKSVLATCVYAIIDPAAESCILSAAGHLPPVLAWPDGTTRVPDLPAGQSLGLGSAVYGQARVTLRPGTVLALYTDGLVENRNRSFDQGITALRAELTRPHGSLDGTRDAVIGSLADHSEDDVTLVLARIPR